MAKNLGFDTKNKSLAYLEPKLEIKCHNGPQYIHIYPLILTQTFTKSTTFK